MLTLWHRLGQLESLSLILLVNLAMPLKYLADQPLPVRIGGMLHGLLFMAYLALTLLLAWRHKWPFWFWVQASAAAFVPFGYLILGPAPLQQQIQQKQ